MRVVITTVGSRGDVAPYTGLAARLDAAGHTTVLATHESFRGFVEARGLRFAPLAGDPRELMTSPGGHRWQRAGSSALGTARLVRLMRPYARELADRILDATADADVVLTSALTFPAYHVARGRGIPSMGVHLQPLAPTREFPPVALGRTPWLGSWGNRVVGSATLAAASLPFMTEVNALRRRVGLPPTTPRGIAREADADRWPVLHGVSRHVVPRPADWRPGLEMVGWWWPQPDPAWSPPPALVDFLAAGPPPVVIGFGSMATAPGEGERLTGIAVRAARSAGVRAVLQEGWSGLSAADTHLDDEDVLSIGEAPHSWLFPHAAAVVHHAGVGTSGAALRHGIPAVPVPVLADQPFWAARLHARGAATAPLPFRRLTAERLAAALRQAVGDPALRARSVAMGAQVAAEDGAGAVVDAVTALA
jgi:UDP:flavonoid glycosyltransferase YjiC (YdhE family)